MKRPTTAAGIEGHYSNHSLRRRATRLFEAGVDEQLIMLCTGHSTTSGVRSYKRVSEQLKEVTSDVLNGVQTTKKAKLEGESAIVCTLGTSSNEWRCPSITCPSVATDELCRSIKPSTGSVFHTPDCVFCWFFWFLVYVGTCLYTCTTALLIGYS